MGTAKELVKSGRKMADRLRELTFSDPVSHTYLTVDYASDGYEAYLKKFGDSKKRVLMLGMNPGPYGMAQTGVPFGEISMVRDWMGLDPKISKPAIEHPKRPVLGMDCPKSEVSGRRLWGYFSERFPDAGNFFKDHLVINYCPLIWMKATGANLTPDKIKSAEMVPVDKICQEHLCELIEILEPQYLIGVGAYAEKKMSLAKADLGMVGTVGKVLHPSPASPAANRGWSEAADRQLRAILGGDFGS